MDLLDKQLNVILSIINTSPNNLYNTRTYNFNNIVIYNYKRKNIIKNIEKIQNNLFGKIILEKLVEKVFNPIRLKNIADNYNVSFEDLLDYY